MGQASSTSIAHPFLPRRADAQVGQFLKAVGIVTPARPAHPASDAQLRGVVLEVRRQRPVADDDQVDRSIVNAGWHDRERRKQVVEPLDRMQATDCGDNEGIVGYRAFLTQLPQGDGRTGVVGRDEIADVKHPVFGKAVPDQVIADAWTDRDPGVCVSVAARVVIATQPGDMNRPLTGGDLGQSTGPAM